jgi:hypothetical protein
MKRNFLREVIIQMVQNEELPRILSPNLVLPNVQKNQPKKTNPKPKKIIRQPSPESEPEPEPLPTVPNERPKILDNFSGIRRNRSPLPPPLEKKQIEKRRNHSPVQIVIPPEKKLPERKRNHSPVKNVSSPLEIHNFISGEQFDSDSEDFEPPAPAVKVHMEIKKKKPEIVKKERFVDCMVCQKKVSFEYTIQRAVPSGDLISCTSCFNKILNENKKSKKQLNSWNGLIFKTHMEDVDADSFLVTDDDLLIFKNDKNYQIIDKKGGSSEFSMLNSFEMVKMENSKIFLVDEKNQKATIYDVKENTVQLNADSIFNSRFISKKPEKCYTCETDQNELHFHTTPQGEVFICDSCVKLTNTPITQMLNVISFDPVTNETAEVLSIQQNCQRSFITSDERIIFFLKKDSIEAFDAKQGNSLDVLQLEDEDSLILEIRETSNDVSFITKINSIPFVFSKDKWGRKKMLLPKVNKQIENIDKFSECISCHRMRKTLKFETPLGAKDVCFFCIDSTMEKKKPNSFLTFEFDPKTNDVIRESEIKNEFKEIQFLSATEFLGVNHSLYELNHEGKTIQLNLNEKFNQSIYDSNKKEIICHNDNSVKIFDLEGNLKREIEFKDATESISFKLQTLPDISFFAPEEPIKRIIPKLQRIPKKKEIDELETSPDPTAPGGFVISEKNTKKRKNMSTPKEKPPKKKPGKPGRPSIDKSTIVENTFVLRPQVPFEPKKKPESTETKKNEKRKKQRTPLEFAISDNQILLPKFSTPPPDSEIETPKE